MSQNLLIFIFFIILAGLLYCSYIQNGAGITGFTVLLALTLGFANFDKIETLKYGANGFEFKTRLERKLEETQAKIEDLQKLAVTLSEIAMGSTKMIGRWNGFNNKQQLLYKENLVSMLKDLKVDEATINKILEKYWHPFVEFDYAILARGGNTIPEEFLKKDNTNQEAIAEWEELGKGGIEGRSSPNTIEEFWTKYDALTPERKKIIEDYRYYIKHREHKDPLAWESQYNN